MIGQRRYAAELNGLVRCEHCGELMDASELIVEEGARGPMYMSTEDEYRCPYCMSYDIDWDPQEDDDEDEDYGEEDGE